MTNRSMVGLLAALLVTSMALVATATSEPESSAPPAATSQPEAATDAQPGAVEWLYVQGGGAGSLELAEDGGYQLTLFGVDPTTLAFSNTPDRVVEVLSTADVAATVSSAPSKPNAALQIVDEGWATVVLTLTDADYDTDSGTLTYAAQLVTDDPAGDPVFFDDPPTGTFTDPVLFIDDETSSDVSSSSPEVSPTLPPGFVWPETGSTCEKQDNTNAKADKNCWFIAKGGENWPPMYSELKVTFKNTGDLRAYVSHCFSYNQHHLEPGDTVELTFKAKSTFVCSGWQKKDASKDGKWMKIEITDIKDAN